MLVYFCGPSRHKIRPTFMESTLVPFSLLGPTHYYNGGAHKLLNGRRGLGSRQNVLAEVSFYSRAFLVYLMETVEVDHKAVEV